MTRAGHSPVSGHHIGGIDMLAKFWIVCTEGFDWESDKEHHFAVANGVFDDPDKAKEFAGKLAERYKGKMSDADISIFGPVLLNVGYSMLKTDKSVYDGKKWIKETTLKAKTKQKEKQMSDEPDRSLDMDFDIEGF